MDKVEGFQGDSSNGSGLVSGPNVSRSQICPGTLRLYFGAKVSKSFRAGNVSQPEMSKCLGPEVSRGLTWFASGSVLELPFK